MKRIVFLVAFCLIATSIFAQNRAEQIRKKMLNPKSNYVFVVAHRGDWRNYPENSIAAIESAAKMGVDIVEIDVQKTKDGHLIVMHDTSIDRTTTGKGKIKDLTLDSIQRVFLKKGNNIRVNRKVPTLEQALLAAKGKVMLNLDKADRFFSEVYPLLVKTGTVDQIVMKGSKSPDKVKKMYGEYLNHVIYMPIVNLDKPNAEQKIEKFVNEFHPIAFELLYKSDTNKLPLEIKKYLKGKSKIWYNTLWDTMAGGHDDQESLSNLENGYGYLIDKLGAHYIQTDRPEFLIKYLRSRGLHN